MRNEQKAKKKDTKTDSENAVDEQRSSAQYMYYFSLIFIQCYCYFADV